MMHRGKPLALSTRALKLKQVFEFKTSLLGPL